VRQRLPTKFLFGAIVIVSVPLCATVYGEEQKGDDDGEGSLVPDEQQLSSFEIDLARARALSQTKSSVSAAVPLYRDLITSRPDAGDVAVEFSGILTRLGMFKEAIRVLEDIRGPVAGDRLTRVLLGQCYLWSDQALVASKIFNQIVASHPNDPNGLMYAARAATNSGEHTDAVAFAERFARVIGSSTPRAHFEVAQARFGAADIGRALEQYRQLFNGSAHTTVLTKDELLRAKRNYGLALSWSGIGGEALPILRDYLSMHPGDSVVELELMRVYARHGDAASTLSMMNAIRSRENPTALTLLDLAEVYAAIGHYHDVRTIVGTIVSDASLKERHAVRLTEQMAHWGAFSEATKMLQSQIALQHQESEAMARLGAMLVSDEQPFRARSVYESLLRLNPDDSRAHCGLAALESTVGNKAATEMHLRLLSDGRKLSSECRLTVAGLWAWLKRFDTANELLDAGGVPAIPEELRKFLRVKAMISRLARREAEALRGYREITKSFPDDAEAAYWVMHYEEGGDPLAVLLSQADRYAPRTLLELSRSLIGSEEPKRALQISEYLVQRDAKYLPALMLRAELRSVDGQYSAAIADYDQLLRQLPDSSKLRLGRARALAFSRQYDSALHELHNLHAEDPENLEILREAARFAYWARRLPQSLKYYDQLIDGVGKLPANRGMAELRKVVQLERQAKAGISDRRLNTTSGVLAELVESEPGNKEAIFDLAQVRCADGLISESIDCYDRIIALAPLHRVAPEAREQLLRRQNPILQIGGYYRSEDGRGELARMSKQQYFAGSSVRSGDDWRFGFQANFWREQPHLRRETFDSFGPGVDVQHRFGRGVFTRTWINGRFYADGTLGSRATGGTDTRLKLDDWNELTVGYERVDEIFNRFGLEDETQSDNLWLNLTSTVQRDFELTSQVRFLRYTDDNAGFLGFVEGYQVLTDLPGRFRVGARGEFRHTDERNIFRVDSTGVSDIEHAYWTPRQYGAGFLFLDWHHELRDLLFCEQNRHYYKIRLAPFTATDGNTGLDLTAEWNLQLQDGLGFAVQVSVQRSRLYDAEQLSGVLRYNF
jgi:tetratricopeptide (TPR) repeat protein